MRKKAAKRNLSLNQIIVEELSAATTGFRKRADFNDVVGQWQPDAAFDKTSLPKDRSTPISGSESRD